MTTITQSAFTVTVYPQDLSSQAVEQLQPEVTSRHTRSNTRSPNVPTRVSCVDVKRMQDYALACEASQTALS